MLSQSWKKLQDHSRSNDDQSLGERKEEREDGYYPSYYPFIKTEETSVGNGDKPLLPDYSNVSEKHFTYGNTCLNLAGFTPSTCNFCKLNTDIQERTKALLGLKCLPYCLCVLPPLSPAGYSSTAGCWKKNGEVRHSNLQLKLQRAIQTRQCSNLQWKSPRHDDWRTECWQKPQTSSPSVC